MVSDIEKAKPNNGMLVSKDRNWSGMMADNTSRRASHQCGVSTSIEGWGLVYREVGKVRW